MTIFEKNKKAGGILRYGIPPFKLNDDFLDRELKDIQNLGVKVKTNYSFKGKGAIEKLLKDNFKAIFVSTSLYKIKKLDIPGSDSKDVFTFYDFLWSVNNGGIEKLMDKIKNKNIAIIGGGSVA